jgi:hypothetical protein
MANRYHEEDFRVRIFTPVMFIMLNGLPIFDQE